MYWPLLLSLSQHYPENINLVVVWISSRGACDTTMTMLSGDFSSTKVGSAFYCFLFMFLNSEEAKNG
jgi:hypothetical protein